MSRPINAIRGRISTFDGQEDSDDLQFLCEASSEKPQPDKGQATSEADQTVVIHVKVVRYDSNGTENITTVVSAQRGNHKDVGTQTDPVVLGIHGYVPCDTKFVQTDDTLETDTLSIGDRLSSPDTQTRREETNEQIGDDERSVSAMEEVKIDSVIQNDAGDIASQLVQTDTSETELNKPIRDNTDEQCVPLCKDNQIADSEQPVDYSSTFQELTHDTGLSQPNTDVNDHECRNVDAINTTEGSRRPQASDTRAPNGTNSNFAEFVPEYLACEQPANLQYQASPLTFAEHHDQLSSRIQQLTHTFSQSLSQLVQQLSHQTSSGHQSSQHSVHQPSQLQQQLSREQLQQPLQQSVHLPSQMVQQPTRESLQYPTQYYLCLTTEALPPFRESTVQPSHQSVYLPPQTQQQPFRESIQQPSHQLEYLQSQMQQQPFRESIQQPSHQSVYLQSQTHQQPFRESIQQPSHQPVYLQSQMQQLPFRESIQQPSHQSVYLQSQMQQQPFRESIQQPSHQSVYLQPQTQQQPFRESIQQPSHQSVYLQSQMQQQPFRESIEQPSHQSVYLQSQMQQQPFRESIQQPLHQSVYLHPQTQQQPFRESIQQPSHQPVYLQSQMQQQQFREPAIPLQSPLRIRYRSSQRPPQQEPPQPTQQQYRLSQQTSSHPQQQPLQQQAPLGLSTEPDLRLLNTATSALVRSMDTLRTLLRPHLAMRPGPLREINAAVNAIEVALRSPLDARTAGPAQRRRLVEDVFRHVDTATRLTTLMASGVNNPAQQSVPNEERPSDSGRELNRLIRSVSRTLRRPRCVVEGAAGYRRDVPASSPPPDMRVFRPSSPDPSPLLPPDDSILSVISRLHSKTATSQLQRMLTELPRQQRILAQIRHLAAETRVPVEYAINTPILLHMRHEGNGRFSCVPKDPPAPRAPVIRPVPPVQATQFTSDAVVPPSTNAVHWSMADGSLGPAFRSQHSRVCPPVNSYDLTPSRVNPPPASTERSYTCNELPMNTDNNPAVEKWRSDLQAAVYRLQTAVNTYLDRDNSPAAQTWAEAARNISSRRGRSSDGNANVGWANMTHNELFAHLSSAMECMDVDANRNDGNDSLLSECMEAEQAIRDAASQTNTGPRYISLQSECFSLPDGAIPTIYRTPSEFGASFDAYLETLADNVRYTTQNVEANNTEPAPGASTYLNVNEFIAVLNNLRAHIQHVILAHENQSTNTGNMPTVVDQRRRIRYSSMANHPMRNNHQTMTNQPITNNGPTNFSPMERQPVTNQAMANQPVMSNHQTMAGQSVGTNQQTMMTHPVLTSHPTMPNQPAMTSHPTVVSQHEMSNPPTMADRPVIVDVNIPRPRNNSYILVELPVGNRVFANELNRLNNRSNDPMATNTATATNKPTVEMNQTVTESQAMDLNRSNITSHPSWESQSVFYETNTNHQFDVMSNLYTMTSQSLASTQPTMMSHPIMTNHPTMANQSTVIQQGTPDYASVASHIPNSSTYSNRPSTLVTNDYPTVTNQQTSNSSIIVSVPRNRNSHVTYQRSRRSHSTGNRPSTVTSPSMGSNPTENDPVSINNTNVNNKSTVETNQTVTESQPMDLSPTVAINQTGVENQVTFGRRSRSHRRPGPAACVDRFPPPPYNYVPRYIYPTNGAPRLAYVAQPNPSYRGGLENYPILQSSPPDPPYHQPPAPQPSDSAEQDIVRQFQQINDLLRDFSNNL